ncbi:uncharacterized protein LOC134274342 isoform X5 [Saccostrea cucullata]|uniref:uncharacterized protein LOC134274342 isoform X5 n=1 Tax=Saccostrea cuccullata TaxID=36930 RepID=UPI002ED577E7
MDLSSLVIVLLTILDTVIGLECSKCTHVVIKNVPSILSSFLKSTALPQSPQCASTPPGQTANGVSLVKCPSNPTSGQVYKCVTYTGTVTVKIGVLITVSVNADIVYRDCVLMDPAVPASCAPQNNIPADNAVLKSVLSGLANINAVTFEGTRCVAATATHLSDNRIVLYTFILLISKYLYHL